MFSPVYTTVADLTAALARLPPDTPAARLDFAPTEKGIRFRQFSVEAKLPDSEWKVFRVLQQGAASRASISKQTGLTRPAVLGAIMRLRDKGLPITLNTPRHTSSSNPPTYSLD